MSTNTNTTVGQAIFSDIEKNTYLQELYGNILFNYSLIVFGEKEIPMRSINIEDSLRFADILSKSTDPKKSDNHKIWAQEIVALLNTVYPDNPTVKFYLDSVLSSTGNYRGLTICDKEETVMVNNTLLTPKDAKTSVPSQILLDRLFTEYSRDFMRIPAEPNRQFFRNQKAVYDLLNEQYFSYSGPTSMGKSYVMRMFIKKQIQDGIKRNFAIVVPTTALINEVSSRIIQDLGELLAECDYKVITSPGALALQEEHNFVYVLTPERLLYLLISDENVSIDCLFIDEAHKISARDSRSAFYYKVVDMSSKRGCEPHVIFASPNIPNPEVYLKLIPNVHKSDGRQLATTFSPVSQVKYLVNFQDGTIQVYNSYKGTLMPFGHLDNGMTFGLLISKIGAKSQNIIYCNSISKVIDHAVAFAKNEPIRNDKELQTLAKDIANEVHGDYYLSKMILRGVAYHIGYLPSAIRMRIEKAFGDGLIQTVFCTSTLLEGVNLPADNLFITSYKNGKDEMDVVDFRNLVGRVGRIEYNLYGNVYLVRLPDEKRFKTETYIELLKSDVPEQSLSVVEGLSDEQKQIIVDSLLVADLELNTTIKIKDDDYPMMRKFAMILLRDITKNNHSFVRHAFAPFIQGDIENRIKEAFSKLPNEQDDDINVSVDQSNQLMAAIAGGLKYPKIDSDGYVEYDELMHFLERLCYVFKWERYEKDTLGFKGTNGQHGRLRWYGIILSQWVKGEGLRYIMNAAISYKHKNRYKALWYNFEYLDYNDSSEHRNIVISQTLEAIERIILFSISNYFLKFTEAFKKHHKIEGDMPNDWYEYVEYGTTNRLSIMFQRHGFSRETATFIRKNAASYVIYENGEARLRKSIASCGSKSIENEVADVRLNVPELFVD